MRRLDGKTVVLTGASGGIGSALTARLRGAGAVVTGIGRGRSAGCDRMITADLADGDDLAVLASRLSGEVPDILVNLAGVQRFGLHGVHDAKALETLYAVNLVAPAVLAAAVSDPMKARGSGQIVNIGSAFGAIPYPWFAAYSSSKAGLAALSQALRRELAGSGVVVTHISPRATRTSFNTADVDRFMAATGAASDDPDWVAMRIAQAIAERRSHVILGRPERFFAFLNALAPGVVDKGLAGQVARARTALSKIATET